MSRRGIAKVYITPALGTAEFRVPVPFNLRHYSRRYVRAYAEACRRNWQGARIVWP